MIAKFLEEYEALCKKYKFYVSSCGCCESPFILPLNQDYEIEDNIEHLKEEYQGKKEDSNG